MRKKDDEKQRCIKNAVVQLILEVGFQGASISKIAKAAGVSPATVYIYYENKDAMLRDIYQEYAEDTIQSLLQCLSPNMAGEEIIEELIRQYYSFIVENKEIFHFNTGMSELNSIVIDDSDNIIIAGNKVKIYDKCNLDSPLFVEYKLLMKCPPSQ